MIKSVCEMKTFVTCKHLFKLYRFQRGTLTTPLTPWTKYLEHDLGGPIRET